MDSLLKAPNSNNSDVKNKPLSPSEISKQISLHNKQKGQTGVDSVPFRNFNVSHEELEKQCLELIFLFFPHWKEFAGKLNSEVEPSTNNSMDECIRKGEIELCQMKDGITNKLIMCKNRQTEEVALVRVFGKKSEFLIDRTRELETFLFLSDIGLAPRVFGRFSNGIVYGYFEGPPCIATDIFSSPICDFIAKRMALWHRTPVSNERKACLFKVLGNWIKQVPDQYSRKSNQEKSESLIQERFSVKQLSLELDWLNPFLTALNSTVVLCHNDLLCANIIQSPDGNSVQFIDYEYADYNFRSFDIANHFCEYAGFDCNYDNLPNEEYQRRWLRIYLENLNPESFSESDVDSLYHEVCSFMLAPHMFWGIWALVQAENSDIDFDYLTYAKMRFEQYEKVKRKLIKSMPNRRP